MHSRGAQLQHQLIHVAPAPLLTRLHRTDDRMIAGTVVGCGMTPWRVIAATDVAACLAHAQMHPMPTGGQALLTARYLLGRVEDLNRVEMSANGHRPIVTQTGASSELGADRQTQPAHRALPCRMNPSRPEILRKVGEHRLRGCNPPRGGASYCSIPPRIIRSPILTAAPPSAGDSEDRTGTPPSGPRDRPLPTDRALGSV